MRSLFVVCICFLPFFLAAQLGEYSRVKVDLKHHGIGEVAKLGLEVDHGYIRKGQFLINDFHKNEIVLLEENGIGYEILIEDVQDYYVNREDYHDHDDHNHEGLSLRSEECLDGVIEDAAPQYKTPDHYRFGAMGGFLTYSQAMENIDSMRVLFPHLISEKTQIGNILTHEGRAIYYLRISDNPDVNEDEPEVLYTSLHHAREPGSLSQNLFYMWYLLENYETNEEVRYLVNNTEMYFIPIVNPDGYIYNELTNPNGGGLWRKNRRPNENGGVHGVDLNRNYEKFWGFDNSGSSGSLSSSTYRGPSPFSEPETQAVKLFCETHNFLLSLNYHSYGNVLIHPWGYRNQETEEDELYKAVGNELTRYNNFQVGTNQQTIGYILNGGVDDYLYGEVEDKNKIYGFTPEVGSWAQGFWPPPSEIDANNKSVIHQNLSLAAMTLNHGVTTVTYDKETSRLGAGLIKVEVSKIGFQDGSLNLQINPVGESILEPLNEIININQLEVKEFDWTYQLPESALGNYQFEVVLDNGKIAQRDTFEVTAKMEVGGEFETILENNVDDELDFVSNGSWGLTSEDFVSGPVSMTDSPNTDYEPFLQRMIILDEPFDLSNASKSNLKYSAKWEFGLRDYVKVQASNDLTNWVDLCGVYTQKAVSNITGPLYAGSQLQWVNEVVNLDDFNGNSSVWIQFSFKSDGQVEGDGFYFDDIEVEIVKSTSSNQEEEVNAELSVFPNPVHSQLSFKLDRETLAPLQGIIYDQNSRIIYNLNKNEINCGQVWVQNFPAGIYYLKLNNGSKYSVIPFVKQ